MSLSPSAAQLTYIIGRATRDQMVALDCLAEGYGNDAVIMCAPE
jgi:hypothetical protein